MDMEWIEMPQKGVLSAYTTIHIAPTAMIEAGFGRENPYCSGIVELENGHMICALINNVDPKKPGKIKIGSSVKAEFMELGKDENSKKILAFRVLG
jgi:uncharacterized OB-fold protein